MLTSSSIVFVHGLCGHSTKTWTKDDVCWPKDLLSKEEPLSHTRILTFGYDANIVDTTGRASLNSLFQHSINLLLDLSRERQQDAVSCGNFAHGIYLTETHSARPSDNICGALSRRADSKRCMLSFHAFVHIHP